tara:strand:- start:20 stop:445 length:426 start_codon:yes stop_codon:yes gene_type:complete
MKRSELKKLIKPIVKECIHESLFEDGILSKVISEVLKGTATKTQIVEAPSAPIPIRDDRKLIQEERQKLLETKRQMLDAIGKDAYNGINLFEGTAPIKRSGIPGKNDSNQGPLKDVDPYDPGVDISSLMGNSDVWKQIVNS